MYIVTYNERDSQTSWHIITLDGLWCREINQSAVLGIMTIKLQIALLMRNFSRFCANTNLATMCQLYVNYNHKIWIIISASVVEKWEKEADASM